MMKTISILTIALLPLALFSNDEKMIEATMQEFWSAWTGQDLQKAATYIAPQELEKGKSALLPVFLASQSNEAQDIQEITNIFFGKAKGVNRSELSKEDVFVGINKVVFTFMG
jgi:hypothetical protein